MNEMTDRQSANGIDVSLVITVFNHWDTTRRCLDSIYRCAEGSALRAEVILSDNCSEDQTPEAWRAYQGRKWPIRYFRNAGNLGYLRNANAGAGRAVGKYLCLMNNDVIVRKNWLDALAGTLRSAPDVGLAAPMYVIPAGRVLECGAAVRSDGTILMIGHDCAEDDPRLGFVREADYASAACAVTPRALFAELGGYDERYVPAYYEDVDYCFRLQERGYRVVVNPEAQVVHASGTSLVEKDRSGWLAIIAEHRKLFRKRWAKRLAERQPGPDLPAARYRCWDRKPAYVFHTPAPLAAPAEWNAVLGGLRARGHHVAIVAPRIHGHSGATLALQRSGVEVHRYPSRAQLEWVARELTAAHPIEAVVLPPALEPVLAPIYARWAPGALRVVNEALETCPGSTALEAAVAAAREGRRSQPEQEQRRRAALAPAAARLERRWGDPTQFNLGGPPYGGSGRTVLRVEQWIDRIPLPPARKACKLLLWIVSLRVVRQIRSRVAVSEWLGPTGRLDARLAALRPRWLGVAAARLMWLLTLQLGDRLRARG